MTTVRLRKSDLEILATIDNFATTKYSGDRVGLSGKELKAWSSLYERVLAAEMKPRKSKSTAISVNGAIEAFRGVLGKRLVVPAGNPGPAWYGQLQNRLTGSGMTAELCERAATAAGVAWKGAIRAESIVRQADVLLSEAGWSSGGVAAAPQEREDMQEL